MRIRRLAQFGELGRIHIETKLGIAQASPPHLVVLGQARYGSVRFVHTAIYSVPCRAGPGSEGSVNRVIDVLISSHLKEGLAWAVDKWLQLLVASIMLFKISKSTKELKGTKE